MQVFELHQLELSNNLLHAGFIMGNVKDYLRVEVNGFPSAM